MIRLRKNIKSKGIIWLLWLLVYVSVLSCSPWRNAARRNITVVFYNAENLFDVEDESGKEDDEFTPGGAKNWNLVKYEKKVNDISRVISSVNEGDLPEIVGLCEVENERVVRDLIFTDLMSLGKYDLIHYESPDTRGIDCALIYRPAEFKVIDHFPVPVVFENDHAYKMRNILYVKGYTRNREEFHIFVNHWPSRIGGVEKTEAGRLAAAGILKNQVDSIMAVSPNAHIIIMGDMNDEPKDRSLAEIINAGNPWSSARLVNLMIPDDLSGRGSYNYQGDWKMFDNLIVNQNLLDDKGFRCIERRGYVFHHDWMENMNRNSEIVPYRTYLGTNYLGGISDHFPVYFRLRR
jgi:predicted extracellular nuclease